jgi:hypothetical protein
MRKSRLEIAHGSRRGGRGIYQALIVYYEDRYNGISCVNSHIQMILMLHINQIINKAGGIVGCLCSLVR